MNYIDVSKERMAAVEILGVPGLFTPRRINRATVPAGMYAYDMQTSADDWNQPKQIAAHVAGGYFGAVLTASPIQLPESGCLELSPGDFTMAAEVEHLTIAEFEAKYLPPPVWPCQIGAAHGKG